jgi:hypothetical protein
MDFTVLHILQCNPPQCEKKDRMNGKGVKKGNNGKQRKRKEKRKHRS